MSQGRRIVVFSNKDGKREVLEDSKHLKWAELKTELAEKGFAVEKLEAVVRGSRTTLQHPDADLPSGEFTLILIEKEMKSGIRPAKQDQFTDLTLSDLKKVAKKLGLKSDGDRPALLKRLRNREKREMFDVADYLGTSKKSTKKSAKKDKKKASKKKSVAKEAAVPSKEEPTTANADESAPSKPSLDLEAAKQQVAEIIVDAKDRINGVLDQLHAEANNGIDLFKGIEEDADYIRKGVK